MALLVQFFFVAGPLKNTVFLRLPLLIRFHFIAGSGCLSWCNRSVSGLRFISNSQYSCIRLPTKVRSGSLSQQLPDPYHIFSSGYLTQLYPDIYHRCIRSISRFDSDLYHRCNRLSIKVQSGSQIFICISNKVVSGTLLVSDSDIYYIIICTICSELPINIINPNLFLVEFMVTQKRCACKQKTLLFDLFQAFNQIEKIY